MNRPLALTTILLLSAATMHAQATPRRGWFATLRVGLSYGRAACDTPCVVTRRHVGTQLGLFAGHTIGDRTALGIGSTTFGSVTNRQAGDRWTAGGIGLEVAVRPTPTDHASAFALLGVGEAEMGPQHNGAHPVAGVWALGAAVDDPTRRSLGGYGELHGTLGASMPQSSEFRGRRISTFGVAAGAQSTLR